MTDEEFIFKDDVKNKSKIAQSSHRKSKAGGKYVKFPSDYLSKKEKEKMNGDIISYNMNNPISWETFKTLPNDLKKEYISSLMNKFNLYGKTIATELFGISYQTMGRYLRENNCAIGLGGDRKRQQKIKEFRKWITQESSNDPCDPPTSLVDFNPEFEKEYTEKLQLKLENKAVTGSLTFERVYIKDIYSILKGLLIEGCQYDITISFDKSEPLNNNYKEN